MKPKRVHFDFPLPCTPESQVEGVSSQGKRVALPLRIRQKQIENPWTILHRNPRPPDVDRYNFENRKHSYSNITHSRRKKNRL